MDLDEMDNSSAQYLDVDGVTVRYRVSGNGPPVLLLHGWGGSIESFIPVFDDLRRAYCVCAIDFPGFGRSSLPPGAWGVSDYASLTLRVMDLLQLERPHLLGHSFGGRVAIVLAARHPERVGKLVLVDSAGIRLPPTLKGRLKRLIARGGRWLGTYAGPSGRKIRDAVYRRIESQDYANAGSLRQTFVKVVNEDLRALLPLIQAPVLLVWGADDRDVPLAAAHVMADRIPGAQLVVFENAGHFSYLDQFERFRLLVGRFLRGERQAREVSQP